jgi:polyferredoxin
MFRILLQAFGSNLNPTRGPNGIHQIIKQHTHTHTITRDTKCGDAVDGCDEVMMHRGKKLQSHTPRGRMEKIQKMPKNTYGN